MEKKVYTIITDPFMISETYRQTGIVDEGEALVIVGSPSSTRDVFFEKLLSRVEIRSRNEYQDETGMYPKKFLKYIDDADVSRTEPSYVLTQATIQKTDQGNKVQARIWIDRKAFPANEEIAMKFINLMVLHEIAELWAIVKKGFHPNPDRNFAHKLALLEDYYSAFEQGIADEYLTFVITQWAPHWPKNTRSNFVLENIDAYVRMSKRYKRKLAKFK